MARTVVCIPVTPDGQVGPSWGRAARVAVASVTDGAVGSWDETDVRWDALHDEGTEGGHHARVARFLIANGVQVVAADHMGPPMVRMLGSMGIGVVLGAGGEPREVAVAAVDAIAAQTPAASPHRTAGDPPRRPDDGRRAADRRRRPTTPDDPPSPPPGATCAARHAIRHLDVAVYWLYTSISHTPSRRHPGSAAGPREIAR